ncbi:hypothetical protein T484DRAFT_1852679 [Baffinella frigidus]|nr:hypothetical protein T484DRAFT_1852679 [Cryptophyta sp. CCMP2293]
MGASCSTGPPSFAAIPLLARSWIPHGCIVLHGHSLGAAVATRVAGVLSSQGKAPAGFEPLKSEQL